MLRLTKRSVVAAALPLLCLAAGCSPPATRIVVVVDSNVPVPGELSSLAVRVCAVNDREDCPAGTRVDTIPLGTTGGAHTLPVSFDVVPSAMRRTSPNVGQVLIEVVGTGPGVPRRSVRRTARLPFAEGRTAVLPIFLSQNCLLPVDGCAAGQTCQASDGLCISDAVISGRDYVVGGPLRPGAEFDVRLPDASAPADTGTDAPADVPTDAADASVPDERPDAVAGDAGCVMCGTRCVDLQNDPYNCGRCDNVCAPANNATAGCVAGACQQILCVEGFDDCNGDRETDGCEVDLRSDPAHCMSCGGACPVSTTGARVCSSSAQTSPCGFDCNPGYALVDDACVAAPRLIGPVSGSVLTRHDPTLSYSVPPGAATEIELCAGTRSCAAPTRVFAPSPSANRLGMSSRGVWFWRVRGRFSDGRYTPYTPWWQFFLPGGATPPMSARPDGFTGLRYDANLDGFTDIAVSAVYNRPAPPGGAPRDRVYFYAGGPGERTSPRPDAEGFASRAYANLGFAGGNAGDVNGDGYADAIFTSVRGFAVFHGGARGLAAAPQSTVQVRPETMTPTFYFAGAAGDTNRDGYGDVLVATNDSSGLYLYTGGPGGLSASRYTQLRDTAPFPIAVALGGFDANGDGAGDVVVAGGESSNISLWLSGAAGLVGMINRVSFSAPGVSPSARVEVLRSGDVNGDGYSDLVAGFPNADEGAGLVAVYFGDATAPFQGGATPAAVLQGRELGVSAGARFGTAIATADFDGDGYDEIAVSVPGEGRVLVFHGLPTGIDVGVWATLTTPGRSGLGFGLAASPSFDSPELPTLFALHGGEPAVLTSFRGLSSMIPVPALRPLVLGAPGVAADYKFGRAIAR